METTLRMFYARALFLLALAFLLMIAFATAALAQDAAPAARDPDLIDLFFSTTSAAIYWLLGGIWVALKPPAWIKDFFATKDAFHWDGIVDTGLDRAEALVRRWGIDATKDRNGWINAMVTGLNTFNPEIAGYLDTNKNGVIDFLEGYVPPRETKVSPALVALIATRLPADAGPAPMPTQGFMSAPKPRVSDAAIERLAKFSGRAPKGATKQ